jgi:hypothetical protein
MTVLHDANNSARSPWCHRRSMRPLPIALALVAVLTPLAMPGSARAGDPTLYLSWHAPHGMPRASDRLTTRCDDTTRVDTLWLSFDPGEDAAKFYGMFARLRFHPAEGDTLGPFWHFKTGAANQKNLAIEFAGEDFPLAPGWVAQGMGAPSYEFNASVGTLDLIYAVREADAAPIQGGKRYAFSRVLFKHRRAGLAGCMAPTCIEWALGRLGNGQVDRHVTAGPRFVTWNGSGRVCDTWRAAERPKAWTPPQNRAPKVVRRKL